MKQNRNEMMMSAIESCDVKAVRFYLLQGADPNYSRFKDEDEPHGYLQPTTPLRLVMFCISDAMVDENQIKQFGEIAKLLLEFGADPAPAMQIAESRYGKYNPDAEDSPFMNVWSLVARAKRK